MHRKSYRYGWISYVVIYRNYSGDAGSAKSILQDEFNYLATCYTWVVDGHA